MNKYQHIFDEKKWTNSSIFYQMGNIGSEYGRAQSALRRGDQKSAHSALFRGVDLLNASINSLAEHKSHRLHELLIARDQFVSTILKDQIDQKLDDYFFQFALAARLNR